MKFKLNLLAGTALCLLPALAFAQMVPGSGPMIPANTASGIVSLGPANAVPYWAVAGNKLVPMTPENNAVLITGPTGVPSLGGTISGNTTEFATVGITPVSGSCAQWDGSLNITSTGIPCSTSSGSVNPGTVNQMTWYASTGSIVSGLPTANNGVLATSNTGVPSIATTLPLLVQGNITQVGTITTGVWNGTVVTVTYGGTGDATFTTNGVIYGNGTGSLQVTAQGAADSVLTANAGAPAFSDSPTINNLTSNTSVKLPYISPDSIPYVNATNNLTDSTELTFNGVDTLTVPIVEITSVMLKDASGPGIVTLLAPNTTFSNYQMTFPTTPGSVGQPLLSAGGGGPPTTWGTLSGNTTEFATVGTTPTSGACAQWDGSGNITSTGSACSSSSGTISPGTVNDIGVYTGSTTIGPIATSAFGVLNTDGSGVPSITDSPTIGTLITVPNVIGGTAPSSNLTIMATSSGSPSGDFIDFEVGGASALTLNDSQQSSFFGMVQLPSEAFVGSSSGAVTIQPNAAAGTYTMTLPVTAGTAGQLLTSAGGGATPMTWTSPSAGSGTVNPGTTDQMPYYPSSGSAVSPAPNLTYDGTTLTIPTLASTTANISTNLTAPFIYGGVTGSSNLTLESTSGTPTTDFVQIVTNGTQQFIINHAGQATFTGIVQAPNIIDTALTTNGVVYANGTQELATTAVGGANSVLAANSGTPFFTGGPNLNAVNLVGTSSGTITLIAPGTSFTPWTFNFPLNAGSSGQPLLSSGGLGAPQTYGTLGVGGGGTGDTTFTTNGVVYGNGTSALNVTAQGGANTVLTANSGAPSFSAAPTIGTSVTTPQIYGGSGTASQLRITATSNGSPSSDKIFLNAGGLIKEVIDDGGVFISQGAPGTNATAQLEIAGSAGTAGSAQLKFASSTLLGTPETGAVEYNGQDLFLTNNNTRRTFQVGNMAAIAAATITTTPANFGSFSVTAGESYIIDYEFLFTVSTNTVVTAFNATNLNATNVVLEMLTNSTLTPTTITNVVVNGGGSTTAPGSMVKMSIRGLVTAATTGTFSVALHTSASTVALLAGSYFSVTEFE